MMIAQPDPWMDLSQWMQRRAMVKHCLTFNMGDSAEDVKALVDLIDLGIRARLRFLYDLSVQQSIDTIPMPRTHRPRRKKETTL